MLSCSVIKGRATKSFENHRDRKYIERMYLWDKFCSSKVRLEGKTTVITGANSGIGKETARDFYKRGARVILACRNSEKAKEAVEDIKNNPPSSIEKTEYQSGAGELAIYILDLCSFKSVRECAKKLLAEETAIHILVNNAGIAVHPYEKTEDGHETTLQANHLGHFLLTLLLLPKMQSSSPGCRIINVSSILHYFGDIYFDDINLEKSCKPFKSYTQSKLANVLFTKELARRLTEANIHGINVYSLHPGIIPTKITRHANNTIFPCAQFCYKILALMMTRNAELGAQTTIHCSVDQKVANETGLFYSRCNVARTQWRVRNEEYGKKLWDISCKLVNMEPEEVTALLQT